jgi:hypothetical protein
MAKRLRERAFSPSRDASGALGQNGVALASFSAEKAQRKCAIWRVRRRSLLTLSGNFPAR